MREHQFWRLVTGRPVAEIGELLRGRSALDIIRFHHHFRRLHLRACRWDVWTAFGLVLGGAGAGQLRDGVCWLILRGRRTYHRALVNPDVLAEFRIDPLEITRSGDLAGLALRLLTPPGRGEVATACGEALAAVLGEAGPHGLPPGERPSLDADTLARCYPRLTARYGLVAEPITVLTAVRTSR
ncbi:DUF4240 domain-containing protein [Amycolatopsis thermalba]|uniref:DUF4240 domain-containing protein n=1 Tax=Amycolatopsis thermalba TaxID=944492 RepID=A0ABY4NW42_9PSEU|nr:MULTISPECIES: DUF4240 domain-containing protein [Amycolatopsis]UQS24251.1 DUF4240 domain-containing protein [Amycolatopsis thermalba]